jgi:hypothetical protein
MQQPDPGLPTPESPMPAASAPQANPDKNKPAMPVAEIGGREGPDPTRFGDWERNGRCIDF